MFKINQQVVAIKTHSEGIFKKGQEFIVQDITNCRCGLELLKLVNLIAPTFSTRCSHCLGSINGSYFLSSSFVPLESVTFADELLREITKEIEEEQLILK